MRRLSITSSNLQSYNQLFTLGNIRKDIKDRTISYTTQNENMAGNVKGKNFTSSTITDLRQHMMKNSLQNLIFNHP